MPAKRNGLLIVNADDLGLTSTDTDAILDCYRSRAISSATALVWMRDSDRAADLAARAALPVGLHLNLIEPYTAPDVPERVAATQLRVVNRLRGGGLGSHLYHPGWARDFDQCIADQLARFDELYGHPPTHVDGHRHMHLALNALLAPSLGGIRKCRPPVTRRPAETRRYKHVARMPLGWLVRRRFATTDWCFSVRSLHPALGGAGMEERLRHAMDRTVEVFVHPGYADELPLLRASDWRERLAPHRLGTYRDLG